MSASVGMTLAELATALGEVEAPQLRVKRLHPGADLPARAGRGSAGYDVSTPSVVVIPSGERKLIPIGIAMALPPGTYGQISARSGLASRNGIMVMAGIIDEDYRGEIQVLLYNSGDESVRLDAGARIAQIIIKEYQSLPVMEVDVLDDTERGDGGFGSTGA